MLWGVLLAGIGTTFFAFGVVWETATALIAPTNFSSSGSTGLYDCGLPILAGILLIAVELKFLLPYKRHRRSVRWDPVQPPILTVVLTAFNDETSIGAAVADFSDHPSVRHVIVIDNDSVDGTKAAAETAGAEVIQEKARGYGHCVYRALQEALERCSETGLILLCEGDRTFRAADIEKFLAYIPHAEIVNGTRIVEQLRERDTQLSTFIYYGNFLVGKLLELKHIGRGTFTDVGTTYKLCRKSAVERVLPHLDPRVNLEFNAHFLDIALRLGIEIVECPITFHARVGQSKGGNVSDIRALTTGLRMILGMLVSWRAVARHRI